MHKDGGYLSPLMNLCFENAPNCFKSNVRWGISSWFIKLLLCHLVVSTWIKLITGAELTITFADSYFYLLGVHEESIIKTYVTLHSFQVNLVLAISFASVMIDCAQILMVKDFPPGNLFSIFDWWLLNSTFTSGKFCLLRVVTRLPAILHACKAKHLR